MPSGFQFNLELLATKTQWGRRPATR